MIQVVRVSGTIKKAEEAAINLARVSIKRARRQAARGKGAELSGGVVAAVEGAEDGDVSMEDDLGFGEGIEDDDDAEDDDE